MCLIENHSVVMNKHLIMTTIKSFFDKTIKNTDKLQLKLNRLDKRVYYDRMTLWLALCIFFKVKQS